MTIENAGNAGAVDANASASAAPVVDNAWLSSVPENLRDNDVLKGHASLPEALQEYVDLKVKSVGMIAKPTEKSTPEDIAAYRKAIGVPDAVDGYEVGKPENWPKDEQGNDMYLFDDYLPLKENMLKVAHEKGASKEVAESMWKTQMDFIVKSYENFEEYKTQQLAEKTEKLEKYWGQNLPKNKAETIEVLNRFESTLKDDDSLGGKKAFQEARRKIENEPELIHVFHSFYKSIGNDGHISGGSGGGPLKEGEPVFSSYKNM